MNNIKKITLTVGLDVIRDAVPLTDGFTEGLLVGMKVLCNPGVSVGNIEGFLEGDVGLKVGELEGDTL